MKAFMSSTDDWNSHEQREVLRLGTREVYLPACAEREARDLLAVTEEDLPALPWRVVKDNGTAEIIMAEQTVYRTPGAPSFCTRYNTSAVILAEALRAFVGDGAIGVDGRFS